jgi:hypothetical protein
VTDAFNPASAVIPITRVEGITHAVVMPAGTGHVVLGQGALVDLSGAQGASSITKAPVAMFAVLGEAGAAVEGGSRAPAMLRLREALQDALDFSRNRVAWNAAQRRPYARGRLDLEALGPVVRGELPLAIQTNRASDLLAAMRLTGEFNLKLILIGAAEGWMVASELATRKIPVVVKPLTDIPSFDALRRHARECGALRAVSLAPALVWGVADRVGSLEVGKDADLVVWSGDPFEVTTGARARLHRRARDVDNHAPARALRSLPRDSIKDQYERAIVPPRLQIYVYGRAYLPVGNSRHAE